MNEIFDIPTAALEALTPAEPQNDTERLIASVGEQWPVHMATWTEVL